MAPRIGSAGCDGHHPATILRSPFWWAMFQKALVRRARLVMGRTLRPSGEGSVKPWMPWADKQSTEPSFQRDRLRRQPELAARGEEWQYGLFPEDERKVLGSFGLMTRRGPGTMEIGYWVHVGDVGRGHATRAVTALVDIAFGVDDVETVLICCDEANLRSAAIPRKLGFTLRNIDNRPPEAPGEVGRLMTWALARDAPRPS